MFANGPGDLGSIPGRVIPKIQKMVLDASLLNTQHYKVRIKGKVKQSREGVAPSPTPWCSSYRKGSLRVTLDYGRPLYFIYIYIYFEIRSKIAMKRVFQNKEKRKTHSFYNPKVCHWRFASYLERHLKILWSRAWRQTTVEMTGYRKGSCILKIYPYHQKIWQMEFRMTSPSLSLLDVRSLKTFV